MKKLTLTAADWARMRARYESGEPATSLVAEYKVSLPTLYRKRDEEGWGSPRGVTPAKEAIEEAAAEFKEEVKAAYKDEARKAFDNQLKMIRAQRKLAADMLMNHMAIRDHYESKVAENPNDIRPRLALLKTSSQFRHMVEAIQCFHAHEAKLLRMDEITKDSEEDTSSMAALMRIIDAGMRDLESKHVAEGDVEEETE